MPISIEQERDVSFGVGVVIPHSQVIPLYCWYTIMQTSGPNRSGKC